MRLDKDGKQQPGDEINLRWHQVRTEVIDPFANKSGQGQDGRHHQCPPAPAHRQHAHYQHQRYEHRLDEIAAWDQFHKRRHDEQ